MFLPLLENIGYPLFRKDILVLTYSGIRGRIALLIAMINYKNPKLTEYFKE